MSTEQLPPEVSDRRVVPPGVLPRNLQPWVLGGVALIMVLIICFSGRSAPKSRPAIAPGTEVPVLTPNEDKVKEYQQRIEEQSRKLALEQAQLMQSKRVFGAATGPQGVPEETAGGAYRYPLHAAESYGASEPPQKNWIQLDKEKRDYESLFASNLAFSYRRDPAPAMNPSSSETSREPRSAVSGTATTTGNGTQPGADRDVKARHADLNLATGKNYRLFEGTIIETVLTNRLDGYFSGPVNCMVTTDIYSHDHQRLLIPKGSRVLGEVRHVETAGQQRLAVAFHRLIMPDGYSLNLDQFHGLNQLGETGLRDQVNHHYLQIFGASIAIGSIAGLAQANTRYGVDSSANDVYRQGVASSLAQSSLHVLDRFLNILPTFTVREGHRIKVYLSQDLNLPAYENHEVPDDL